MNYRLLEEKIGNNQLLKARSSFQDSTNGSLIAYCLTIFPFLLKSNCWIRHLMFPLSPKILWLFVGLSNQSFQLNCTLNNGPDVYDKSYLWLCQLLHSIYKASIAASFYLSPPPTQFGLCVCVLNWVWSI